MLGIPNTIFKGTAGPGGDKPGPDSAIARSVFLAFLAVCFPVAMLTHTAWLLAFYRGRMKWWVPAVFLGVWLPVTVLAGGFRAGAFADAFISPWNEVFAAPDGLGSIVSGWFGLWAAQFFLGVLFGSMYSSVSCAWKWARRPQWKEQKIKPGPFLKWRYRKSAAAIAEGSNTAGQSGGVTIGVAADRRDGRYAGGDPGEEYGRVVYQTDAESAQHTLVTGGSGSGKTSTMLMGMRDVIRMGRGLVVIDCKGGPDVPEALAGWAARYGRRLHHWSIHDPRISRYNGPAEHPGYYDPISRGDASRRKDLLVGSQRWDVEYYKSEIGNYLQTVFSVMDLVPPPAEVDTFTDVADLLSPNALLARAGSIEALRHPALTAALTRIPEMDANALSGIRNMYSRFHTLTASSAGQWLRKDPNGKYDINLREIADRGDVVVFSLDSSNYRDTASLVAGLIIQDLTTLSSELRHRAAPNPLHVYVDEFSAVDTVNMIGLLNKARDSRMPTTISTQTLADLDRLESTFSRQVSGVISSFLVHRANTEEEATFYAGLSGVRRKTTERTGVEQSSSMLGSLGSAAGTGVSYLEERDDYAIAPGEFQRLSQGQCVYLALAPHTRYVHPVHVVRENYFKANAYHAGRVNPATPSPPVTATEQTPVVEPYPIVPVSEYDRDEGVLEVVEEDGRQEDVPTGRTGKPADTDIPIVRKEISAAEHDSAEDVGDVDVLATDDDEFPDGITEQGQRSVVDAQEKPPPEHATVEPESLDSGESEGSDGDAEQHEVSAPELAPPLSPARPQRPQRPTPRSGSRSDGGLPFWSEF